MRVLSILALLSCGASMRLVAQRSNVTGPVAIVRDLYADFACEAVIDEPGCGSRHELLDQPVAALERYFDPTLGACGSPTASARRAPTRYVASISFRSGHHRIRLVRL